MMPSRLPDPNATEDYENAVYAIAIGVVLSVGLLLIACVIWKAQQKKRISPTLPDPNLKGGSQ